MDLDWKLDRLIGFLDGACLAVLFIGLMLITSALPRRRRKER